jgi:hypothetical protein
MHVSQFHCLPLAPPSFTSLVHAGLVCCSTVTGSVNAKVEP